MSTAVQLITRALRRLQAIDIAEQPSSDELSHFTDVLDEMLNGWQAGGIQTQSFTLIGDVTSGENRVSNITTDVSQVMLNLNVSGSGIPANTLVTDVITNTRFDLSQAATSSHAGTILSFTFLPVPAPFEGALVALLAARASEDLGIPMSAKLQMDADNAWGMMLAGYVPDRKAIFDRAIAPPAGVWDAETDWVL